MACTAPLAFTIPQPSRLSGWAAWLAVDRSASWISATVAEGRACSTSATTPAVKGHENDVPLRRVAGKPGVVGEPRNLISSLCPASLQEVVA
jgi:hypothetical protein